ncbi:MAG: AMP-binding protein [Gammaproteobacteria bacterium]|nr:AMP-binding protein [Gammaproteobacteria bacterium]MCF6362455.1 AMP-binding protein [Gammaproteobacteria bacterium]
MIHAYQPAAPMMFSCGRRVSQQNFIVRVVALSRRLPDVPYLINLCRDRYNFALVFCAALVNGGVNLLPPNRQLQTLEEVVGDYPGCCAVVDADETLPGMVIMDLRAETPDIGFRAGGPGPDLPWLAGEQLAAIAFTSGTTGKPSPNRKPWRTLVGTGRMLAARFVTPGERPVIVATVPSQHMYGLEMTLMMALQGGCIIDSRHPFYADDIASTLASLPGSRLLVTTPVHLRAMVGANVMMPRVTKVISATAPLARELAAEAESLFQAPVEEIYGCTEVGSMATRRTINDNIWTLLDGMNLLMDKTSSDGAIHAQGPQLADIAQVEDHLELVGRHRFRLLGRSSDMINVGGKRASLADITLKLLTIEGVDDGVVFMAGGVAGREDKRPRRPAALVVSRLSLQAIRAVLAQRVDPVFLPRPIKKVAALPRNDTGKLSISVLQQLLKKTDVIARSFTVPPQHPCFPAHFPGQPIVPGALLLQWVFAHVYNQYPGHTIRSVRSMKFLNSLHPGDHCRLELDSDPALQRLSIACYCRSDLVCKGVVELVAAEHVSREQQL